MAKYSGGPKSLSLHFRHGHKKELCSGHYMQDHTPTGRSFTKNLIEKVASSLYQFESCQAANHSILEGGK